MTKTQKLILIISVLASFVALLDGSVVNVALPAITRSLGGGLITQQWVVDSYLLTLGSLILLAGSLSDILGRKLILNVGLIGFGVTSLLCGFAPTSHFLIIARGFQGLSGALIVPSSLALIISEFKGSAQGKAIGTWTAWISISYVIGPLLGGYLVDSWSWRGIFFIIVVPILITLYLINVTLKINDIRLNTKLDIIGATLCTLGLSGLVYALIEEPTHSWGSPLIYLPIIIGSLLLLLFVWYENKVKEPMLPLSLFKVRNFSFGNLSTLAIYGGLSIATFLVIIALQQIAHYSAFKAGLAFLPVTFIMLSLSSRFGYLAGKIGPRIFMTLGPIVAGLGFLLMLRTNSSMTYLTQVLPGVLVFGFGLSMTVAPLTAAVLGSIKPEHAGIGSAVNNAVARIAGLIAISFIGIVVGVKLNIHGLHRGLVAMAILELIGGIVSFIGIRSIKKPV